MATILKNTREYTDLDIGFMSHPITNMLLVKKNINAIKQSVTHLLKLKEGDKPFHPEIKSPIYGYLFENATIVLQVVLEREIHKYLSVFEPRIRVINVVVAFPLPNHMTCTIEAEILNIQEPFTITVLIDRLR